MSPIGLDRLGAFLLLVLLAFLGGQAATFPSFAPTVTLVTTTVIDAGSGANDWVGRASFAVHEGVWVAAYYKATNHFNNEGACHVRFSADNGATWTAEDTKLGGGAVTGAPFNPAGAGQPPDSGEPLLYESPNGDLLMHTWLIDYSTSMGGSWQWRSTDGGESWAAEGQIAFGIGGVDDDIIFSTDDYFVLDGVIYAGARIYSGGADGTPSEMILIKSADNGATWTKVSTIMAANEGSGSHGGQEVGLEYLGNGVIVAMLRDNDHTNSYQRLSSDMGLTWGSLTSVTSTVGIAGRQRVYTRAHLHGQEGWWNDRVLIMVGFVHQVSGSSTSRRTAVWVGLFNPSALTIEWSAPTYLHTTTEDGGYSDIRYDATTSLYRIWGYSGTQATASLKQWDCEIDLAA